MACSCGSVTEYALSCNPSIGGITKAQVANVGTTTTYVDIELLPDSSSFNSTMTYDRTKNAKYWTTDITLGIDSINTTETTLVEALACSAGRTIKLHMNTGKVITVSDAFITTAAFNAGASKADGSSGTITLQAITSAAPSVGES